MEPKLEFDLEGYHFVITHELDNYCIREYWDGTMIDYMSISSAVVERLVAFYNQQVKQ